jgi:hypothetical protein
VSKSTSFVPSHGQHDFASDEVVRIAEGLGGDDGQILYCQPPTGWAGPMSFGMRCQTEAGGKNLGSVISSMNAVG